MMVKKEVKGTEFPPTATLKLTEKEGNYIKGTLQRAIQSKTYPNKKSYLIKVNDLEGNTVLWDKEHKKEVDTNVNVGDNVFIQGTTVLQQLLSDVADGTAIEVTYIGTGKAKRGQRPPYLFDVSVEA